jgi:lipopolysaccharide/colanic/teichoic acid biosynthesis glycosyltransferase
MIVPATPVILICILLVRLSSRGPAIYKQQRVGLRGRVFTMYKIRSMRIDAEANGPAWAAVGEDPRVTWIGQWLRKLHLDELPQLFNVLRGEMSLVGPRPERPEFVEVLSERIPGYEYRLNVLPGITGLAQVNLPPDTDLDSVRRKLELDRLYIQTETLWLDLRIVAATALRVVGLRGGKAVALLGLRRKVELKHQDCDSLEGSMGGPTPLACIQKCDIQNGDIQNSETQDRDVQNREDERMFASFAIEDRREPITSES